MDKLTEEYITKLEILVKSQEEMINGLKEVIKLQEEVIKDYEGRMKQVADMLPAIIG